MAKKKRKMPPIHPGETLREDFMKPLGLTANRLAIQLRVPAARINEIVNLRRAISADTALRLARYFGTSPQFWTNLQANYDLELAEDAVGERIHDEVKPHRAA
jgi:antitoxin HigA-1